MDKLFHRRVMRFTFLRSSLCGLLLLLLSGCNQQPAHVTLALLGDVMLGRGVAMAHLDGDWGEALSALKPELTTADLALANLESPFSSASPTTEQTTVLKSYNLCAPAEGLAALEDTGLDVLTLANNHAYDCSTDGPAETRRQLAERGISGLGDSEEALIINLQGVKVALLAFDEISEPLNIELAQALVREAGKGEAVVIVSVHWGREYSLAPDIRQETIAQALADAGADLVWGHHPHVLQPVIWLQGEGQNQKTLVVYSLGNALFDQALPETNRSAMLLLQLDQNGVIGWQAVPLLVNPRIGNVGKAEGADVEFILERLEH